MEPNREGHPDGHSLDGEEHDAEQTLTVPGSRYSKLKEDEGFQTKSNATVPGAMAFVNWGSSKGVGRVREGDKMVSPVVRNDVPIRDDMSSSQDIFPVRAPGGSKMGGLEGRIKEGGAAGFGRENEEITFNVKKGINDDGKEMPAEQDLKTSSFSQVGGGKGVAFECHEKDKKVGTVVKSNMSIGIAPSTQNLKGVFPVKGSDQIRVWKGGPKKGEVTRFAEAYAERGELASSGHFPSKLTDDDLASRSLSWNRRSGQDLEEKRSSSAFAEAYDDRQEEFRNYSSSQGGEGNGEATQGYEKDDKVSIGMGTYEYEKGRQDEHLQNFSSSQVEIGKKGVREDHEEEEKVGSDVGMGTYEYRKGRRDEPSGVHGKDENKISKNKQEMPRQSSASWISAATHDIEAPKAEGCLLRKQAAVMGGGTGGGEYEIGGPEGRLKGDAAARFAEAHAEGDAYAVSSHLASRSVGGDLERSSSWKRGSGQDLEEKRSPPAFPEAFDEGKEFALPGTVPYDSKGKDEGSFSLKSDKVDELRGSNLVQGNELVVGYKGATKTQEEEQKVLGGMGKSVLKKGGNAEALGERFHDEDNHEPSKVKHVQDGSFRANLTTTEERKGGNVAEASAGECERKRGREDERERLRRNVRFGNEVNADTNEEVATTGTQSDQIKMMEGENAKLMRRVLDLVKSMEAKQNIVMRGAAIQVRGRSYRGTGHFRDEMGLIEIGQVDEDESQRRDDIMNAKQVALKENLREKNEKLRDLLKFAREGKLNHAKDYSVVDGGQGVEGKGVKYVGDGAVAYRIIFSRC